MSDLLSRRQAIALVGAAPLAALAASPAGAGRATAGRRWPIGLVSRHVQWTGLEDAIDVARAAGFDAIEWNVRTGGHVEPAKVATDLPRAVELTRKAGLAVTMITTSIQDAPLPSFCKAGPVTRYMVHSFIGTAPRLL